MKEINDIDFERFSDLTKKLQLFDMLIAVEYSKLFLGENVTIRVNERIPNFKLIRKFFITHNIPFKSSSHVFRPSELDILFAKGIYFQDLFIICAILKNFGLRAIFYSNDSKNEIIIGNGASWRSLKKIEEGLPVDKLLQIPFHSTLKQIVKDYFGFDIKSELLPEEEFSEKDFLPNEHSDPNFNYEANFEEFIGHKSYADEIILTTIDGDPLEYTDSLMDTDEPDDYGPRSLFGFDWYNAYKDEINEVFEGDPMNTWNVD